MRNYYMKKASGPRSLLGSVLVALAVMTAGSGFAQTSLRVSGKVTDAAGGAVSGATIVVKSNNSGTISSADGTYNITASKNDVLVVTMMGYTTREVSIAGRATVDVQLVDDATRLGEVIVVGYGTQKREFVTSSISQVSGTNLVKAPAANVSNMMVGTLPGLISVQRSGQPGNNYPDYTIRGEEGGLVLVDGVERRLNSVNPRDIQSVTVLKDAASAAIYGIKGSAGVLLITTKAGVKKPAEITYNGSVTFTGNTAFPELLNAGDYMAWHNKASVMDGLAPKWTPKNIQKMKDAGIYGETDWIAELYKKFGFEHQHNLSASGGTDRIRYYTSLGMYDQRGIIPNTSYKRFNVRANVDVKVAKNLNFVANLAGSNAKTHKPGYDLGPQGTSNPLQQAIYALPIVAKSYTDPESGKVYPLGYRSGQPQNPVAAINQSGYNDTQVWRFEGNAKLEYAFGETSVLRGLKVGVFGAYDAEFSSIREYTTPYDIYAADLSNPAAPNVYLTRPGDKNVTQFNRSPSMGTRIVLRPQISYNRDFGKHTVGAMLLYEQTQDYNETMTGRKRGYVSDYPVDISMGNTWEGIEGSAVSGSFGNKAVASVVGRVNYAYDRRYLVELSFRNDATWKFDPANRWGFFPAAQLGWVVSEEKFFKNAATPINFLKLRATYGESGKDFKDELAYLFVRTYKSSGVWYSKEEPSSISYIFGGKGENAYRTSNYLHHGLTWFRARSYNVGFDMEMWGGKFGVEFDWFYKLNDRILSDITDIYAPSLGGNHPARENYGKEDYRGLEITLRHKNHFANGISYSIDGSLSWVRSKQIRKRLSDNLPTRYHATLGKPGGWLYGLRATGLFQTQEQLDQAPLPPPGALELRLGDIMYEDINGDGKIDWNDYVKIGNSTVPEMMFNINMSVAWKGLSLYAQWQGAAITSYSLSGEYKHGTTDNTMFTRPFYENGNAPYYMVEGAWREDNTNAKYPRLSTQPSNNNSNYSSWWVRDGSYLRLKTLTLAYDLPAQYLRKSPLSGVNVYVSARNLVTFSGFKYVDPELPSINNGYYPQQRTFSIGVDLTF